MCAGNPHTFQQLDAILLLRKIWKVFSPLQEGSVLARGLNAYSLKVSQVGQVKPIPRGKKNNELIKMMGFA